MTTMRDLVAATILLVFSMQASAQATAPATVASKPVSTSLGMVVFPAKGQAAEQQSRD